MIKTRKELLYYLERDKLALGKRYRYPRIIGDEIWRFQIIYRKYEYYRNNLDKKYFYPIAIFYKIRFKRISIKLGYSIPINTIGPGLSLAHYGTIVINGNSKIKNNCRIQENVTIGATNGSEKAPRIGNNVFIGSGAKIIGDIDIADDICIGSGAVVVDSFMQSGITIAGVPAKKISDNNSHSNLNQDIFKGE